MRVLAAVPPAYGLHCESYGLMEGGHRTSFPLSMTNSGAIAYTPVIKEKGYFFCQGVGFLWIFFCQCQGRLVYGEAPPFGARERGGVPPHSNVKVPADV